MDLFIDKGVMSSQIPCGSAKETAYVDYDHFLLFLSQLLQVFKKLVHQSPFLGRKIWINNMELAADQNQSY